MVDFLKLGSFIYIYERRKALGYTQETVAAIIDISDRTLRNIEYGLVVPDIETIMKLWDLYELSPDDLFAFYSRDEVMNEMRIIYENKRKKVSAVG